MKKILFISILFLFHLDTLSAQERPKDDKFEFKMKDSTSFGEIEQKVSVQTKNEIFIAQVENYKIAAQSETYSFAKRKGKTKRKSKSKFLNLNFAEHVFRTFTC